MTGRPVRDRFLGGLLGFAGGVVFATVLSGGFSVSSSGRGAGRGSAPDEPGTPARTARAGPQSGRGTAARAGGSAPARAADAPDDRRPAGPVVTASRPLAERDPALADVATAFHGRNLSEKLEIVLDGLLHDDAAIRDDAVDLFGALRGHLPPVLADLLLTDPDPDVRASAADALGDLGGGVAVEALGKAVTSDPDPDVRQAVAFNLGYLEDMAAVAPLVLSLETEPEPSVRRWAALSLAEYPTPETEAALLQAVAGDPDLRIRTIAEGVHRYHRVLATPSTAPPAMQKAVQEVFEELVGDFIARKRLRKPRPDAPD